MARRKDLPCAGCGELMWRGSKSLAEGQARCRACRHSYSRGCRCEECRSKKAAEMRTYAAAYREKNGVTLRSQFAESTRYWVSQEERQAVYERDGFVCHLCTKPVDRDADPNSNFAPSLDHVVPRSRGGGDEQENLRCAHRVCNAKRGAREVMSV